MTNKKKQPPKPDPAAERRRAIKALADFALAVWEAEQADAEKKPQVDERK